MIGIWIQYKIYNTSGHGVIKKNNYRLCNASNSALQKAFTDNFFVTAHVQVFYSLHNY